MYTWMRDRAQFSGAQTYRMMVSWSIGVMFLEDFGALKGGGIVRPRINSWLSDLP